MARPTKDETIIKNNPGKTPYELLALGLSEGKYAELTKGESKPAPKNVKEAEKQAAKEVKVEAKEPEKLIPEVKASPRAFPKLSEHRPILTEQAKVKGPDGKVTPMLRNRAEKFVRKNPNYKIIS